MIKIQRHQFYKNVRYFSREVGLFSSVSY